MREFSAFSAMLRTIRKFSALLLIGISIIIPLAPQFGHSAFDHAPAGQVLQPSDPQASPEARRLFGQLHAFLGRGILFGQHDAPLYGLESAGGLWQNVPTSAASPGRNEDRSDIKTATGSHPALVGFDIEGVVRELLRGDSRQAQFLTREIQKAHQRGQVITVSWHAHDPVDPKLNFSGYPHRVHEARRLRREILDRDPTECARLPHCRDLTDIEKPEARRVARVLPGGKNHSDFLQTLNALTDFLEGLRDDQGTLIPIIFRPWHEHNGSWFWWGGEFRTAEEFTILWRLTIDHLRGVRGLHHLLIAYSPNQSSRTEEEYFLGYPGDSYIDVFGLDAYHELDSIQGSERTGKTLGWIVRTAQTHRKIPALTETGLEAFRWGPYNQPLRKGEPNPLWFSQNLGKALHADPDASGLAYIMLWRNATAAHHYFPAPDAFETIADFLHFRRTHRALLLMDIAH